MPRVTIKWASTHGAEVITGLAAARVSSGDGGSRRKNGRTRGKAVKSNADRPRARAPRRMRVEVGTGMVPPWPLHVPTTLRLLRPHVEEECGMISPSPLAGIGLAVFFRRPGLLDLLQRKAGRDHRIEVL